MDTKGQKTALFIGGGIAGFLLGYFLKRPKGEPSGVELEQLQITPAVTYPGDVVTISCIATNRGKQASVFTVFATVGSDILDQDVYLEPGAPTMVIFEYALQGSVFRNQAVPAVGNGTATVYSVTVSVGDLLGNFELITSAVGAGRYG